MKDIKCVKGISLTFSYPSMKPISKLSIHTIIIDASNVCTKKNIMILPDQELLELFPKLLSSKIMCDITRNNIMLKVLDLEKIYKAICCK